MGAILKSFGKAQSPLALNASWEVFTNSAGKMDDVAGYKDDQEDVGTRVGCREDKALMTATKAPHQWMKPFLRSRTFRGICVWP